MKYRTIEIMRPCKSDDRCEVVFAASKIPFTKNMSIYDSVDLFERDFFLRLKYIRKKADYNIRLRDIINIHNKEGIKDFSQIRSMIKKIKSEGDILPSGLLPNIRLVKTGSGKWLLFDGHHSMIAYMACGKESLNEVPHLLVYNNKKESVSDEEVLVFFGEHSKKLNSLNWMDYVINWQAPNEERVCRRIQKNMGDLFNSLRFILNCP